MGAAAILLVTGICVFLLWFFEAMVKDLETDDSLESVCVYHRREIAAVPCKAAAGHSSAAPVLSRTAAGRYRAAAGHYGTAAVQNTVAVQRRTAAGRYRCSPAATYTDFPDQRTVPVKRAS